MEAIQTLINALVVAAVGLGVARMTHNLRHELKADVADLRGELKADIAGLDERLGGLRGELKTDISELRIEVRGEFADLRAEIREVRSDLTRVALAVGAEPRATHQ